MVNQYCQSLLGCPCRAVLDEVPNVERLADSLPYQINTCASSSGNAQCWGDLAYTAEAQGARREKLKHLCVLGVSAVHVSYSTFKWRTPLVAT